MDTHLLESLGLTKNEALVYITLVKTGSSKTGQLLKESGINTGKIYDILNSLKKRGLVSETIINKVKHFSASPSEKLLEYINAKKEILKKEENTVKSLIPQIELIRKSKTETTLTEVYTGVNGFKSAIAEANKTLNPRDEILAMGVRSSKGEPFNTIWKQWAKETLPKNHERVLFSEKGDFYEFKLKSKYSKIRLLESSTPTAMTIFGKQSALILRYDEPVRVIFIKDKMMVATFISLFEQLWKIAK